MGCDIHTHIEYKREIYCGNDKKGNAKYEKKWLCGDYFLLNPFYKRFDEESKYKQVSFCDDRNYSLFATLADVRNWGDTPYIAEPRGLPKDVTKEVKEDSDSWGWDGHSRSYFTLKELIEFQSNIKPLKHRGMISPESAKELDENGVLPTKWCQWTTIKGWVIREWEEENTVLVPLIESMKQRADELNVVHKWLWEENIEKALEEANDIRIVFWFDN